MSCRADTQAGALTKARLQMCAACRSPFPDQPLHVAAQSEQAKRTFAAVPVERDLGMHSRLRIGHLEPQCADFPANFINSVVHGLLEQKENI
jgi:hypothetical protein